MPGSRMRRVLWGRVAAIRFSEKLNKNQTVYKTNNNKKRTCIAWEWLLPVLAVIWLKCWLMQHFIRKTPRISGEHLLGKKMRPHYVQWKLVQWKIGLLQQSCFWRTCGGFFIWKGAWTLIYKNEKLRATWLDVFCCEFTTQFSPMILILF